MKIKPTLFLRNAEGSSPGGGAPTPPPTPAPANGAPQPAAATISVDEFKGMLAEFRNGIFADLRKAGALGKPTEPQPTSAPAPAPAPIATQTLTQADVMRIATTQVAIAQLRDQHSLNDAQVSYLSTHLEHAKPADVYLAAKTFLSDLGLVKAAPPSAPTASTPAATSPTPTPAPTTPAPIAVPQLGAPSPGDTRDVEAILASRPLDLNQHDIVKLTAKHGFAKAMEMVQTNVNAYLSTVKLVPESRRQR